MKNLCCIAFCISMLLCSLPTLAQSDSKKPCACCSETHRQFDFWLGDWVTTTDGNPAGTNKIISMQNGCVLQENWISATPGYTGTSYNFYNKDIGKWQQIWVDNKGANLILTGELIDNQMIMESQELKNDKGEKYFNRIIWTNNQDGTVRQVWEVSKDGKTRGRVFLMDYTKRKSNWVVSFFRLPLKFLAPKRESTRCTEK